MLNNDLDNALVKQQTSKQISAPELSMRADTYTVNPFLWSPAVTMPQLRGKPQTRPDQAPETLTDADQKG